MAPPNVTLLGPVNLHFCSGNSGLTLLAFVNEIGRGSIHPCRAIPMMVSRLVSNDSTNRSPTPGNAAEGAGEIQVRYKQPMTQIYAYILI